MPYDTSLVNGGGSRSGFEHGLLEGPAVVSVTAVAKLHDDDCFLQGS